MDSFCAFAPIASFTRALIKQKGQRIGPRRKNFALPLFALQCLSLQWQLISELSNSPAMAAHSPSWPLVLDALSGVHAGLDLDLSFFFAC